MQFLLYRPTWTVELKYYTQRLMKAPSFISNRLIMAKNSYNYRFENYREISHIKLGFFKKFSKTTTS